MAIYHLKASVYSRSKGHSTVAAAAYRARADFVDERTGLRHDYTHHSSRCLFEGLYAPKDAPEWTSDRAKLWNHVEAFETRRNAQLSREFQIALPHELTLEQQRYALQDFIKENFTRKGLIADAVIHAPGKDGDDRNTHAHLMVVMRQLDGSEFERNNKEHLSLTDKKAQLETWRESWEKIGNRHLKRHGFEPSLDRRTLEAQGIDREPGVHLGRKASEMERRGIQTDRGDMQREAANQNQARARLVDLVAEREAAEWYTADKQARKIEAAARTADDLADEQQATFSKEDRERRQGEVKPARPMPFLEMVRQRDPEAEKSRTAANDTRRSLEEMARIDPVGTAQRFGFHSGDKLNDPAELARQAEKIRVDEEARKQQQEAANVRQRAQAEASGRTAPAEPENLYLRLLRKIELDEALLVEKVLGTNLPAKIEKAPSAPEIGRMRQAIATAWDKLSGLVDRLESAFARLIDRTAEPEQIRGQDPADKKPSRDLAAEKTTSPEPERPRSIWDDDLKAAERKAAAQRLRDTLERPGPDHTRGRKR